jgi:hypothetical protein
MRSLPSAGLALALFAAVGIAACSDAGDQTTTTANPPPADEPATTGALPAEPAAPVEEPAPMAPETQPDQGTSQ